MKEKIIKEWENYFINSGLSDDLKNKYIIYLKSLLDNKVPIIFEFNHLCLLLGRTPLNLASMINSPDNFYRNFKIKKKSGGSRIITAPFPSLLQTQYWIYINILKNIKIHQCAHGFANKKSIITNAKLHAGENHLLKLDLKDFFPSIEINRIVSIFQNQGYPNNVSFYLASLCSYKGYLPQGAPTSPILSNIIAYKLDSRLFGLSKKFKLKYTRYADDMVFSGESIPTKFLEYVSEIIYEEGFVVNKEKTQLYKSKSKRIVTGISVQDKVIKIPRNYKRNLKQELNFILKYGLESHIKKMKIREYNYLESIIGKINFWLSVEPENKYAIKSRKVLLEYHKVKLKLK